MNSKDYRSTRLYNDELGLVQSFWNLSIWNWGWISAKKLYTCGLTYYCTFMYVSVHSITSVLLNSFSCISFNDIQWLYSVDYTVTWLELGYFSTLSTFLVRKSFKGSFWDSYPSKKKTHLSRSFRRIWRLVQNLKSSRNEFKWSLERFSKGQKLLRIKTKTSFILDGIS